MNTNAPHNNIPNHPHFPQPKPKRNGWKLAAFILTPVALITGCGAGAGSHNTNSVSAPEPVYVTVPGPTVTVQAPQPDTDTDAATSEDTEPAAAPDAITDGQYEVGSGEGKIKPGKYKTTTPAEENGGYCYVDATDWDKENYYAQEVTDKGYTIVNVPAKADLFSSSGCGEWKKL